MLAKFSIISLRLSVKQPTHNMSLKRLQRKFISIESAVEEPISKVTDENENREDGSCVCVCVCVWWTKQKA